MESVKEKKSLKDVDAQIEQLSPKEIDDRKVQWVLGLLHYAKMHSSSERTRKKRNLDFYIGGDKHWQDKPRPTYRAAITDNRIFSNVESVLPLITDTRPKAELAAREKEDLATVEQLKKSYDSLWDELNLELLGTLAAKDSLIFGEGFLKVWFDQTKKGGMGEISVSHVNPDYLYVDPDSKHPLLDDAKYIIYHAPEPIERIKMNYPKKADELDALEWATSRLREIDSEGGEESLGETKGTLAYDYGDETPTTGTSYSYLQGERYRGKFQPFLTEVWIDDMTLVEYAPDYIVFYDGDQEQIKYTEDTYALAIEQGRDFDVVNARDINKVKYLRKYPYGRIITICENILLRDDSSPYEHGCMPYVRFIDYLIPHTGRVQGEPDQLIPLQMELNKLKSQIIDLFNLIINPILVIARRSGLDLTKITNRPGQILPVNNPDDVKWLVPPNVPAASFASIDQTEKSIDTVGGVHDVTQGRKPTGITAGIAIETLQEAAQTRVRLKARFHEYSLKRLAELMISIIWQFYQEPRTVRTRATSPFEKYEYETVDFSQERLFGGLPDVLIKPGSTMPTNKGVLKMQILQIWQSNGIDLRGLYELFEIPDREEILARTGNRMFDGTIIEPPAGGMVQQ